MSVSVARPLPQRAGQCPRLCRPPDFAPDFGSNARSCQTRGATPFPSAFFQAFWHAVHASEIRKSNEPLTAFAGFQDCNQQNKKGAGNGKVNKWAGIALWQYGAGVQILSDAPNIATGLGPLSAARSSDPGRFQRGNGPDNPYPKASRPWRHH